jgi:hypothetical protein
MCVELQSERTCFALTCDVIVDNYLAVVPEDEFDYQVHNEQEAGARHK